MKTRAGGAGDQWREAWRGCLPLVVCIVVAAWLPNYWFGVSWWVTVPLSPFVGWGLGWLVLAATSAMTLLSIVVPDMFRR